MLERDVLVWSVAVCVARVWILPACLHQHLCYKDGVEKTGSTSGTTHNNTIAISGCRHSRSNCRPQLSRTTGPPHTRACVVTSALKDILLDTATTGERVVYWETK